MEKGEAYWTYDSDAGAWYLGLKSCAKPPYTTQKREMNDKEGGLAPELHQKEEWVHWKVVEIERRGAEPWEIALLDRRHGLIARICATARRISLQLRGIRG